MRNSLQAWFLSLALLAALFVAAGCSEKDSTCELPPAKKASESKPKELLAQLLADYRAYRLPMPPDDAPLVKFDIGAGGWGENGRIEVLHFGFLIEDSPKPKDKVILVGTRRYQVTGKEPTLVRVKPNPEAISEARTVFSGANFAISTGIATAIQCYARGWKEFAKVLLRKSMEEAVRLPCPSYCRSAIGVFPRYFRHEGLTSKTALAYMAWNHWANELIESGTNRAAIYERMNALLEVESKLATEEKHALLDSLKATIAPGKAKPGSVEAFIDRLTEVTARQHYVHGCDVEDKVYEKLITLGFAAVPTLINHLEDERLTRIADQDHYKRPPYIRRVKSVISDFLLELAAGGLTIRGRSSHQRAEMEKARKLLEKHGAVSLSTGNLLYVDKADALAWWKKAKALGEEKYLLENLFPKEPKDEWVNSLILWTLTAKYPNLLSKAYHKLLDDYPHMQSWPMAEAIAKSSLPRKQKVELLTCASKHSNLKHRVSALRELKDLNHKRFVRLLVETLNALPVTPKEPYWDCSEASFAQLTLHTSDPRAWQALKNAAKRVNVALRMEMLNRMRRVDSMKYDKRQLLDFFAEFLDDESVPDFVSEPQMFECPYSSFALPRLSMQNLTAKAIVHILGLDSKPEPDWTATQWAELRDRVRKELKRD